MNSKFQPTFYVNVKDFKMVKQALMALDVFIVDMQHLENSVVNTFNMVWPNGKSMLQTVDLH